MDKQQWKKVCRMTAHASGKKRLGKKELCALQEAQIVLSDMVVKKNNETWKPHKKNVVSIAEILKGESYAQD